MRNTLIGRRLPEHVTANKVWGSTVTPEVQKAAFEAWYTGGNLTTASKIFNDAGYRTINGNPFTNVQIASLARTYIVASWKNPEFRRQLDTLRAKMGESAFEDREYELFILDHLIKGYKNAPKKIMRILNLNPELKKYEEIWKVNVPEVMWNTH